MTAEPASRPIGYTASPQVSEGDDYHPGQSDTDLPPFETVQTSHIKAQARLAWP